MVSGSQLSAKRVPPRADTQPHQMRCKLSSRVEHGPTRFSDECHSPWHVSHSGEVSASEHLSPFPPFTT